VDGHYYVSMMLLGCCGYYSISVWLLRCS